MKCSLPWQSMGIKQNNGVFCCCLAKGGTLCQPSDFPTEEFGSKNIWTEGVLSELWNSKRFKQLRGEIVGGRLFDVCGLDESRCFSMVADKCCTYSPQTEAQINNVQNMIKSFRNNEIEVNHYPVNIDCCLGQVCNMQCPHCCQKYEKPKIGLLPIEQFQDEMVVFLKHAVRLAIFGGEPTVCPQYDTLLALAKKANGAKISLVTNGHFLIQKFLPHKELFWELQVSVDATTADTYQNIRQSNDQHYNFDRLIYNIDKVSNRLGVCALDFFFVINGYNYKEMRDMLILSKNHGCRCVVFNEIFNYDYEDVDVIHSKKLKEIYNVDKREDYLNSIKSMLEEAKKTNIRVIYCFPSFDMRGKITNGINSNEN